MNRDTPRTATGCGACSPSERNRYFRDKRLTVADFELEQEYLIGRRRLINRAMLGWGVVEGYRIRLGDAGVAIGPGLAIDAHGRELVACERTELVALDDLLWLSRDECGWSAGAPPPAPEGEQPTGQYLLSAHYAEAERDGVRIDGDCGSTRCEGNHLCETVVYSLIPIDGCPSGLPDCRCQPRGYPLDTDSTNWPWAPKADDPQIAAVDDRGPHMQLVDWSGPHHKGLCERPRLTKVGCLDVALDDGVPLACVGIAFACGKPHVAAPIDDRVPRRLAYPNDTLFDLIRGCDLTRIQDVGWHDWLPRNERRVSFKEFAEMFVAPSDAAAAPRVRRGRLVRPPVDTRFWVTFSGPVQVDSLTPDVIAITIVQRDANEDVGAMYRVPIETIAIAPKTENDPDNTTRAFRPLVSARFWHGEINPDDASGFETDTLVEIEVRTGFIVDARGQEVAGGGRTVPSDGCTPGGRFLSSFVVYPQDDASGSTESPAPPETMATATATATYSDPIKPAVSPSAKEA